MPDNRETLNEIHHIAEAVVTMVNGTALAPDFLAESVAPLLRALAVLGQKLGDRGENEQLIREITESALRSGISEVLEADRARGLVAARDNAVAETTLLRDDLESLAGQWVQEAARVLEAGEAVAHAHLRRCATELRAGLRYGGRREPQDMPVTAGLSGE